MSSPHQFSERSSMADMQSCVPPGFRFHPTEEELVGYYLKRKINSLKINLDVIVELDLYKMEPWDIQDRCKLGYEEQNEWYFFSHKDKKYPTGTRTNRATAAGFWKATGRDKAVMSKNKIIGMRKTLVFYQGRAPNGRKSDWIMHEYRLESSDEHAPPQEEGWVVCRAFKKPSPSHMRPGFEAAQCYFRDQIISHGRPLISSFSEILNQTHHFLNNNDSHHQGTSLSPHHHHHQPLISLDQQQQQLVDLPQLDSPSLGIRSSSDNNHGQNNNINIGEEYYSDVESLDHLFASNLTDTTSASAANFFAHSNFPMNIIPHNSELVIPHHCQASQALGLCFPDS